MTAISRGKNSATAHKTRQAHRRKARQTWAAVLSAALTLPIMASVVAPTTAHAASNNDIVVSNVELAIHDGDSATVGDTLTVSGAWDATNAAPEEGDTFTIGLPEELGFTEAVPFNLEGGQGEAWGTCLTNPETNNATCTLTDEVTTAPELVKGTFSFDVQAVKETTENQVEFDLNGDTVLVDLPGDSGIDDGIEIPSDMTKSGQLNDNKWSMTWTIDIPGAELAELEEAEIFDTLSDNHRLCEDDGLAVHMVRGDQSEDVTGIAEISETGDDADFSVTLAPGDEGFDPDFTYRIVYDTCTIDEQIDEPGTEYTNEATVNGGSTGEVGVKQDWQPKGKLSKQGSVRGGEDRNGVIDWVVTITGDQLAGEDSFTLSDKVGGPHQLCKAEGDFELRGLGIQERYGPSDGLLQNLDGKLDSAVSISDSKNFDVEFTIADDDFAFRDSSNYLYEIRYQT